MASLRKFRKTSRYENAVSAHLCNSFTVESIFTYHIKPVATHEQKYSLHALNSHYRDDESCNSFRYLFKTVLKFYGHILSIKCNKEF